MEIWHRVAFNARAAPGFERALSELGVKYKTSPLPGHPVGLVYFDITESSPRWLAIEQLIGEWDASDVFNTLFSREEVLSADWIRLVPAYEQGYAQPEKDLAWKQATYDSMCPECGVGFSQKAPFRLIREPRLGKKDFMCLYSAYTVFCTPRVVQRLYALQPRGIEVWPAMIHRANVPSKTVSQLVFPCTAEPGLVPGEGHQSQTCAVCGVVKYAPQLRGYMRLSRAAVQAGEDALLSHEWFGGWPRRGYREILVSNRVARLILDEGWQGVALKPVELV